MDQKELQITTSPLTLQQKSQASSPQLVEILNTMQQHASNRNYKEAQRCRLQAEILKRKLEVKKVEEVQKKQKKQEKEVKRWMKEGEEEMNERWDKILNQHKVELYNSEKQMREKHQQDLLQARQKIQSDLPLKGKESSELLSLRKSEMELARQQNFLQAHTCQQKIANLQKQEHANYLKCRQQKIETFLALIRQQHEVELSALLARWQIKHDELILLRQEEAGRLALKHSNMASQVQSSNKKEFNATTRGQFFRNASMCNLTQFNQSKLMTR